MARALAEDLGRHGDVTSLATLSAGATGEGRVVARSAGVLAGLEPFLATFRQVDGRIEVTPRLADGDDLARGGVVADVAGPLRTILTAERTALNLLGHLSGIATLTRRYVDAVADTGCVVRDTRKTTPGLRVLEKRAVRAGGGTNHRLRLDTALLVKDNHIAAAGGAGAAARAALERAGGRPVQVEVESLAQLREVLDAGVSDVLLDNLAPAQCREAVEASAGRARLEASGSISLDTVRAYAEAGVDRVAVGALTHAAPSLDVALDIDTPGAPTPPSAERPPEQREGRRSETPGVAAPATDETAPRGDAPADEELLFGDAPPTSRE